jgi:hypothetical protein
MLAYPPIRLIRNQAGAAGQPLVTGPVLGMMILFCRRNKLGRNLPNLWTSAASLVHFFVAELTFPIRN